MKFIFTNAKILIATLIISAVTIINSADASVKSYTRDQDGATFTLDNGLMKIKICQEDIIEIKYTVFNSFPSKTSLVISNSWNTPPLFNINEDTDKIIISTAKLNIKVNKSTNSITYTDPGDNVILAEDDTAGKKMTSATIAGISTFNCETLFKSPADEALYGLGCHPQDPLSMNYKGRNQDLAIRYMTGAVPVLLSIKGYGLMWDNYSASDFYGAEANNTEYKYVSESGTMVDYYFFYGPEFDKIIALYRETTGQAPMFPKWAFGLFQSQDRYQSQAEVLSVKDNYRNNNIPVDCIVQDWFYWTPDLIGSHVMNPSRYPDPASMVNQLHSANVHAMISIWPVFASGSANYNELNSAGGLTTITWQDVMTGNFDTYYDAHGSNARDIYWRQAKDKLIARYGWDAWWVDQCEPDNGSLLDARRQANFAIGKGIDYFNTYSLMHSEGLYKNWRTDIPGKRAFFLIRQTFAGEQRNATTLWSSDITCTFDAYKIQVPQALNTCMSGIPFWTSDIGGYHLNWNSPDWTTPANRELFTRWFQFGTFCPIFRIHGKGERALFSNNWDSNTKAILLNYDKLRYRLLPYIYSLAWKVTNDGYTIMRALTFDFRTDASIIGIQDQYMFGPAFLVNPVTDQLYSNSSGNTVKSRRVYLPNSSIWYNFWTGETLPGGQTIDAPAPIETIPLFVKAGSIIPMGPEIQFAAQSIDPLEIRVYTGADANFVLYEDEGDTYNYEQGQYSLISLSYSEATKQLTIGSRQGTYAGMPKYRTFNIVFVNTGHGIGENISTRYDTVIYYNGSEVGTITNVSMNSEQIPGRFSLGQNYPNPFSAGGGSASGGNPSTTISYSIPAKSFVSLKVFDILGREVTTLVSEYKPSGNYSARFIVGSRQLASGVYYYRMEAGNFVETKKLILIK